MHNFLRLFTLLVAISLVGCGTAIPTIKPYKMDIQQGNVVTSEMLLKLRPGMTKSQVQFIMGTPLLVDSFHTNRWDYFYQLRKQGEIVNQRRVILDFEKGLLVRVRGDVVPKGQTVEDVTKQIKAEDAGAEVDNQRDEDQNAPVIKQIENPDVQTVDPQSEAQPKPESSLVEPETANVAPASKMDVPESLTPKEKVEPSVQVEESPDTVEHKSIKEGSAGEASPKEEVNNSSLKETTPPLSDMNASDLKVFQLDRTLDTSRMMQKDTAAKANEVEKSVVQEIEDNQIVDDEPPSFFERALEKIGF